MNESSDGGGTSGASAPRVDAHAREARDVHPGDMALDCVRCGDLRRYDREPGSNVVRCAACGKRHSVDSLEVVL